MTETKTDFIAEAISEHWGERCPDNEPGCFICDAWSQYDSLRFSADLRANPHPEIEIRELREIDNEGLMGFYARGHFDRWKFAKACNHYTGADRFHDERHVPEGLPDYVRHEWWRCVPCSGTPGMSQFVNAEPKSRGAFPVTVSTVLDDRQRKRVQREINEHQKGERNGFANGLNWSLRQLDDINPDAGVKLLARYRAQDNVK